MTISSFSTYIHIYIYMCVCKILQVCMYILITHSLTHFNIYILIMSGGMNLTVRRLIQFLLRRSLERRLPINRKIAAAEAARDRDRISELPDVVLHMILSLLPIKTAIQMSILSKKWSSICDTLPYLDFSGGFLHTINYSSKECRNKRKKSRKNMYLLDTAVRMMERRLQRKENILKLVLVMEHHSVSQKELKSGESYVKRCMSYLTNHSLKDLELRISDTISSDTHIFYHYMPSNFLSLESLTRLSLLGFDLKCLPKKSIKFPSLRILRFIRVYLDDSIMENLILGCPNMEIMELRKCIGVKKIEFKGLLPKLKDLVLVLLWGLKMIDIDNTPELENLEVQLSSSTNNDGGCILNFINNNDPFPAGLKTAMIYGKFVSNNDEKWICSLVSGCRFLENLAIGGGWGTFKKIKIVSDSLQILKIQRFLKLYEVEIVAPNLRMFVMEDVCCIENLLINVPKLRTFKLRYVQITEVQYDKVVKNLQCLDNVKTVYLQGTSDKIIIPKDERKNLVSPLPHTNNLYVYIEEREKVNEELLDYLLWLAPAANYVDIYWRIRSTDNKYFFTKKLLATLEFWYKISSSLNYCLSKLDKKGINGNTTKTIRKVEIKKYEINESEIATIKNFFQEVNVKKEMEMEMEITTIGKKGSVVSGFDHELYTYYDELFLDKQENVIS